MKTVKKATVQTVQTVSSVLHVGITVTGNVVKSITDHTAHNIAKAEGYLVSKIDSTRDSYEVQMLREEHTQNKMLRAAKAIDDKRQALNKAIEDAKEQIKEKKDKREAKKAFKKAGPIDHFNEEVVGEEARPTLPPAPPVEATENFDKYNPAMY